MNLANAIKKQYVTRTSVRTDTRGFLDRMGIPTKSDKKVRKYKNIARRVAIWVPVGAMSGAVLVFAGAVFATMVRFKTNSISNQVTYTLAQRHELEESTYRPLNRIEYVSQGFERKEVAVEYTHAVNEFAYKLSGAVNLNENAIFSPLASYIGLDLLSHAGDDASSAIYESVLGDETIRDENYANMLRTNFFVTENGSTQIYNGVFFNVDRPSITPKQEYVNFLTSRKTEAYQASFKNDLGRMAAWANDLMGERMLDPDSFDVSEETALFQLTLANFKAKWQTPFKKENSGIRTFYGKNKTNSVNFMNHIYSGYVVYNSSERPFQENIPLCKGAYEYEKYFSVYDRYHNGYSVQYLVPKSEDDFILDVLSDVNFLEENPDNYYFVAEADDSRKEVFTGYNPIVRIDVPTFKIQKTLDLVQSYEDIGLGRLFEKTTDNHVLGKAINGEEVYGSYLESAKQISSIEFDEQGTVAQTIQIHAGGAGAAAPYYGDGLHVVLNQPFVYVIHDPNGLPLYIGSVMDL
ncbi:MAG: hypothetical protein J6A47_08725 [Bacilli bacterium]|nr:hypothetical protein [Bacilli bacterium]